MILMRMGDYILPDAIPANEYLTIEVRKISTSQNYAIWLKDFLEDFPPDPLRYTLAANAPENRDTDFSWKQFQSRNNDELADILGNFVNRTVTFCHRYFGGMVPEIGNLDELDCRMLDYVKTAPEKLGKLYESYEVRKAAKEFMDICRSANKYFNDKAPWETRKTQEQRCATTIHICLQVCRVLSIVMAPILPDASRKLLNMLNIHNTGEWEDETSVLKAGDPIGEAEILFRKIEDDEIEKAAARIGQNGMNVKEKEMADDIVEMDEFKKVVLKTGVVLEAEKIDGTDKLLKLLVDLGSEKRQVVAGVAESYQPRAILGKTVIVAANLKPAMIRGVESRGMILAVATGEGYALLTADKNVDPGVIVE
jgi:methionyl-tRNA synthetase